MAKASTTAKPSIAKPTQPSKNKPCGYGGVRCPADDPALNKPTKTDKYKKQAKDFFQNAKNKLEETYKRLEAKKKKNRWFQSDETDSDGNVGKKLLGIGKTGAYLGAGMYALDSGLLADVINVMGELSGDILGILTKLLQFIQEILDISLQLLSIGFEVSEFIVWIIPALSIMFVVVKISQIL